MAPDDHGEPPVPTNGQTDPDTVAQHSKVEAFRILQEAASEAEEARRLAQEQADHLRAEADADAASIVEEAWATFEDGSRRRASEARANEEALLAAARAESERLVADAEADAASILDEAWARFEAQSAARLRDLAAERDAVLAGAVADADRLRSDAEAEADARAEKAFSDRQIEAEAEAERRLQQAREERDRLLEAGGIEAEELRAAAATDAATIIDEAWAKHEGEVEKARAGRPRNGPGQGGRRGGADDPGGLGTGSTAPG